MKDFKGFGEEVFKTATDYIIDGFIDIEVEEIMEIAKKHGLVKYLKYDPKQHNRIDNIIEEGAWIWWWEN